MSETKQDRRVEEFETKRFEVTREQREDTINQMIGDLDLTLQEDCESILELPRKTRSCNGAYNG